MAKCSLRRQTPKVGATCGKAARVDLCGGRSATGVPTAISRIAAFEIVPEGRFVASFKMLPLAVALLEASRSRSALPNAL